MTTATVVELKTKQTFKTNLHVFINANKVQRAFGTTDSI